METIQQSRPEIGELRPLPPAPKERTLCEKLKATRLSVELGNSYIVWSICCHSLKSSKLCHSGLITADDMSNPEIACGHLQNIITQNNLTQAEVDLYLSISDALLRCNYIPAVPKNELAQVVRWECNKIFPFTFESALYDWKIAETLEWGGSKKYEIQTAAVPRDRILPIFELFQKNSLTVSKITFSSLAWEDYLRQNLAAKKSGTSGNVALARLVGNDLTILFFHKYFLEFMRENNLEAGSLGGGFEESLRFLSTDKFSQINSNLALNNIDYGVIAKDINDSLDYYYGQFSQRNIENILIAFPPQIQTQAVAKLGELLGVEVAPAYAETVTDKFACNVPVNLLMPSGYISSKKSKSLNLVPAQYRREQRENKHLRRALFTAGFIALIIAGLSFFQQWQIKTEGNTSLNLNENLEQIKASPAFAKIQTLSALEQNFLTQVNTITNKNSGAADLLKALSNLTPDDIRIVSLDILQDKGAAADKYIIDMNGFTEADSGFPEVTLANYIKALKQIEFVSSVKLQSQNMLLQSEGKRLAFDLELELN